MPSETGPSATPRPTTPARPPWLCAACGYALDGLGAPGGGGAVICPECGVPAPLPPSPHRNEPAPPDPVDADTAAGLALIVWSLPLAAAGAILSVVAGNWANAIGAGPAAPSAATLVLFPAITAAAGLWLLSAAAPPRIRALSRGVALAAALLLCAQGAHALATVARHSSGAELPWILRTDRLHDVPGWLLPLLLPAAAGLMFLCLGETAARAGRPDVSLPCRRWAWPLAAALLLALGGAAAAELAHQHLGTTVKTVTRRNPADPSGNTVAYSMQRPTFPLALVQNAEAWSLALLAAAGTLIWATALRVRASRPARAG